MTTHIWKKMLSSLLCGILSVSCMTATVFAIDGKSVSGAFGEHWDEVQESYETSFGWDYNKHLEKDWTDDDTGNEYERQAGYQEEWYRNNILTTKQYLGVSTGEGGNGSNIVEVALSQLGLDDSIEIPPNSNFVKYNDWYYGSHRSGQWCAAFVSWCANECDLLENTIPKDASCSSMFKKLTGRYGYAYYPVRSTTPFGGSYTPVPGDLMFFSETGNLRLAKPFNHIGIIVEVDETGWYTVEGNTTGGGQIPGGGVAKNHYTASTTYKAAKNGYIVHVEYPETAFSEIQGGTNKEKVFSFLTEELGLNNAAACGVMANIQNESGFNPARHEDKNAYGDGLGAGYGLCQWSYSRKTSLLSFLQENGFAEDSIDGQLWFFKTEIESSERTAWNAIKDLPNTSDGAYEAGRLWCLKFERPRDGVGDSVERGNLAQNTYWPAYGGR